MHNFFLCVFPISLCKRELTMWAAEIDYHWIINLVRTEGSRLKVVVYILSNTTIIVLISKESDIMT